MDKVKGGGLSGVCEWTVGTVGNVGMTVNLPQQLITPPATGAREDRLGTLHNYE